jgi:hypothetical protein
MEKVTKFQLTRFFLYTFFIFFLMFIFWAKFGAVKPAIQTVLLAWSMFVLCIPYSHGRVILGVPYKIITGRVAAYPEVVMWLLAVILNIISYISIPNVYFYTTFNHMLYRIITTPWPYWLLIFVCALGTFYKFFVGVNNFKSKKLQHYSIRILLMILGFSVFFYFSYKELVILLDIRA